MSVLDDMIADQSINGQHIDIDNEFGGQCWDLVELYAERLGVPKNPWAITLNGAGNDPSGYAKNAWLHFNDNPNLVAHFDQIPAGGQQRGDIGVYNGHGTYVEGHINIFTNSTTGVFEENADPDGSPAHEASRASTYLLGTLRFKGENMTYPNQGDLINLHNSQGWPGHDPNANDIAYWTTGTGNPNWGNPNDVWTDLTNQIANYAKSIANKPQPNQIKLAYKLAFGPNNAPTDTQLTAQLDQPDLSHVLISIEGDSAKAWSAASSDAKVLPAGIYKVN